MAAKKKTKTTKKAKVSTRDEIRDLLKTIDENRYDLYLKLAEVKEKDMFVQWGYETFKEYAEKELNLEYRIALWYAQMGSFILNHNIPRDVVLNVSWTKFKEISLLEDKKQIDELLKKASNMSFQEVKDTVKQLRKNINPEKKITITKLTFSLIEDQYEIVNRAIEEAKEEAGTDSMGAALEYICQEYLLSKEEDGENELDELDFEVE